MSSARIEWLAHQLIEISNDVEHYDDVTRQRARHAHDYLRAGGTGDEAAAEIDDLKELRRKDAQKNR